MKRWIHSIYCDTQLNALKQIKENAISEGYSAEINKAHHCVDVFDKHGKICQQRYAEESGRYKDKTYHYNYVGDNNGDYERIDRVTSRKDYTSKDPYIKYISKTNKS